MVIPSSFFSGWKVYGKAFSPNGKIASYIDARVNVDDTHADKAAVFLTKCLKEIPLPEYPGEKFFRENMIWVRMARKYKMVHLNQEVYIGNYIEDSLTNNRRKHNIASPMGVYIVRRNLWSRI